MYFNVPYEIGYIAYKSGYKKHKNQKSNKVCQHEPS